MNAVCREDLEDNNMSAGIAMSRKTKTLPVSELTSGCRPREVRHASLKTLPHLQAAAVAVCPEKQNPSCEQAHVGVSSTRSLPCQPEDAAASSGCGCRRMSRKTEPLL